MGEARTRSKSSRFASAPDHLRSMWSRFAAAQKEGKSDGGEKKAEGAAVTAVLRVDMHCAGCAKKVVHAVGLFEGVESVSADDGNSLLTVGGKFDPWNLREKVEQKTHKKVVLISPTGAPKREEKNSDEKQKEDKKPDEKPKEDKKPNEKPKDDKKPDEKPKEEKKVEEKPKPPAVSTVVLMIRLHCDGCMQKIRKTVLKVEGVEDVIFDPPNNLVAVKGTMDVNALPSYLETKFKKKVEVATPPKKEEGGGGKKEKNAGGGEGGDDKGSKGGKDKKEGGGDHVKEKKVVNEAVETRDLDKKKDLDSEPKVEVNRMEYYGSGGASSQYYNSDATTHYHASSSGSAVQYFQNADFHNGGGDAPRAYMPYGYPIDLSPAPQLFSDENPNSCSVM